MTAGCAEDVLKLNSCNLPSDGAASAILTFYEEERSSDCKHSIIVEFNDILLLVCFLQFQTNLKGIALCVKKSI
jgi:hypothetical protein